MASHAAGGVVVERLPELGARSGRGAVTARLLGLDPVVAVAAIWGTA